MQIRDLHQMSATSKPRSMNSGERGFTILEMTVATIMFAIILGAIMGLTEIAKKARFNTLERTDDLQESRIAVSQMAKDALNAGVSYSDAGAQVPNTWLNTNLGQTPIPASGAAGSLTPIISGYQAGAIIVGTNKTDEITFVSGDPTFNAPSGSPLGGGTLNVTNLTNKTSPVLTVDPNNSACRVGDVMMVQGSSFPSGNIGVVTSLTGSTQVNMAPGSTDPLGLNAAVNGSGGSPSSVGQFIAQTPAQIPSGMSRVNMVTYLVISDGSDNGTGTLVRRTYGGQSSATTAIGKTDTPLAFSVTNMTISYVLSDGTVKPNPAQTDLQNVRQITVTITVQSNRRDPSTNEYYTNTLNTTINTRNLGYEKQ